MIGSFLGGCPRHSAGLRSVAIGRGSDPVSREAVPLVLVAAGDVGAERLGSGQARGLPLAPTVRRAADTFSVVALVGREGLAGGGRDRPESRMPGRSIRQALAPGAICAGRS
ncbi:hypothetical protein ABZ897_61755 [Nonomuraea sp. NPDC046802]|uniref:hypothetical protein n=1 Tax=Nonomuraea sp. NPDC046802 TaxID=3154919 RepID=UPI00340487A4